MGATLQPRRKGHGHGRGIPTQALGEEVLQVRETAITSAQVLTANATPISVVPAPGAGRALEFLSAIMVLDYNSATYASNGICKFTYSTEGGTAVSDAVAAAAFLHQANDCVEVCQALSAEVELSVNAPIVFSVTTGEVDTGDSPIRLKVYYRVHETGL